MGLEGVVRAFRYSPEAPGKQFLGAILECDDGREWVISYDEQSPFHAFAGRRVRVCGAQSAEVPGLLVVSPESRLRAAHASYRQALEAATMHAVSAIEIVFSVSRRLPMHPRVTA